MITLHAFLFCSMGSRPQRVLESIRQITRPCAVYSLHTCSYWSVTVDATLPLSVWPGWRRRYIKYCRSGHQVEAEIYRIPNSSTFDRVFHKPCLPLMFVWTKNDADVNLLFCVLLLNTSSFICLGATRAILKRPWDGLKSCQNLSFMEQHILITQCHKILYNNL